MTQFNTQVQVDIRSEPLWKDRVERWTQLDEVSFALCEAISQWEQKDLPFPNLILLAMEGLSTRADFEFASSGAHSPAKFVYTLPNICISVLFQMLKTHTKVFCLSAGSKTQALAEEQARKFKPAYGTIWILSSPPQLEKGSRTVQLNIV